VFTDIPIGTWTTTVALDEDGSVVNGPSTHAQPCFAVRERNGQIEAGPTGSR
jgi:hypothetical protein